MSVNFQTPHEAIIQTLRNCGIPGITWGSGAELVSSGSPYYDQAPEPAPLPYVTVFIPESTVEHTDGDGYAELFMPQISLHAVQTDVLRLSDPRVPGSVFNYLDSFNQDADASMSGQTFECGGFFRTSYVVKQADDGKRDPDGIRRVFVATAVYTYVASQNYPKRGR